MIEKRAVINTAPALMSLMFLICSFLSFEYRLQTFSIAEFIISSESTNPLINSMVIHSLFVMFNVKPSTTTIVKANTCTLKLRSVRNIWNNPRNA